MPRFWRREPAPRTTATADAAANAAGTGLSPTDLRWDLSIPHLTTQYKALYMKFDDGASGYCQFAYGNLGLLVKVAPLGYTFYREDRVPVVASSTYLARSMTVSEDGYNVKIAGGKHALEIDKTAHMRAVINDEGKILYDVDVQFDLQRGRQFRDFGRPPVVVGAPPYTLHKTLANGRLSGWYKCGDEEKQQVEGVATFVECIFTHEKFTNMGHTWNNLIFVNPGSDHQAHLLQYMPRHEPANGVKKAFGTLLLSGKLLDVTFDRAEADHVSTRIHPESGYSIPTLVRYSWYGRLNDTNEEVAIHLECPLGEQSSTTDVLEIFPKWAKDIVSIWAGLPYCFVWINEATMQLSIGDKRLELRGSAHHEITFVHKPIQ